MGSSQKSDTSSKTCTRYAGYIEEQHKAFLQVAASNVASAMVDSPYKDYTETDADEAFFGLGYTISSYASLYDMFGKHMAGLDIEDIWTKMFARLDSEEVDTYIEENAQIDKESYTDQIANFCAEARKINAVCSSSFVIGRVQLEKERIKELAEKSAAIRFAMLDNIENSNKNYLNWQSKLISSYALYMKYYYMSKTSSDGANYNMAWKDELWELNVLDNMRSYLGALPHAVVAAIKKARKRSYISKLFSVGQSAVQGASIGSATGAPYGALIGAYTGWAIGLAQIMAEDGNQYWYTPFTTGPEFAQYLAFGLFQSQ